METLGAPRGSSGSNLDFGLVERAFRRTDVAADLLGGRVSEHGCFQSVFAGQLVAAPALQLSQHVCGDLDAQVFQGGAQVGQAPLGLNQAFLGPGQVLSSGVQAAVQLEQLLQQGGSVLGHSDGGVSLLTWCLLHSVISLGGGGVKKVIRG